MGTKANGNCFEVAAHVMLEYRHKGLEVGVVHGLVTNPNDGIRHIHAWVELGGELVIDKSNGNNVAMPRVLYYHAGEIVESELARYTPDEATREMLECEHYGPWNEALYDLETIDFKRRA